MARKKDVHVYRLAKDFTSDILKDGGKRCIIPGKWILQTVLVWPDTDKPLITVANWLLFMNMFVVEIFHASYVVTYIRADLGNALVALATVTTTFEGLIRFYMIVFKKHLFNDILYKIWKQFWPLSILPPKKVKTISNRCYLTLALTVGCYGPAVVCNVVLTLWPYLKREGLLLKSVYPFEWNTTYVYETIYAWQYFTQWYILILVNTFDFFAIPLMMTCAVQFIILQDVFRGIFSKESTGHRKLLFGKVVSNKEMILKCLNQQNMLSSTISSLCNQLEDIFSFAILFQFVNSTVGLCSSSVVLKVDASKFFEMLTFAIAHMFQLFNYCYVGNEIAEQSGNLANAIYECNWELLDDIQFKKAVVFMIQRSQKVQTLTAAGVTELDFVSYVTVLRIAFSFYTLLDHLFDR